VIRLRGNQGLKGALAERLSHFVNAHVRFDADNWDRNRIYPISIIRQLGTEGLLCPFLPEQFGGEGAGMLQVGEVFEELGKWCSSTRSLLTVHGMVATVIHRFGTVQQKSTWLPSLSNGSLTAAFALSEKGAGSDIKAIETIAVDHGDYVVLNGSKSWVTFGQWADIFLVFVKIGGELAAMLIDRCTPGLKVKPAIEMLGLRASGTTEIEFNACMVSKANLLGKVGTGISLIAMTALDFGRYSIAWGCVGMGQSCLQESLDYAENRVQFGMPIQSNQLVKKMISEMVVESKAARALCEKVAESREDKLPDAIVQTWEAKYLASKMSRKASGYAVQIHGAAGCVGGSLVERHFRDAKIMELIEGTNEMHEILIADQALARRRTNG
jgi:alkylation response protein AidB-like acyl-CoA dehydrogenase